MLRQLSMRHRIFAGIPSLAVGFASFYSPLWGWMDDQPEWKYPALTAIPFGYVLGCVLYQGGFRQQQLETPGIGLFGMVGAVTGFWFGWIGGAIIIFERGMPMFCAFHAGCMYMALYMVITTALALHQPARKAFKQPRRFKPPSR